jgi:signal transduction histidine kinase/CHASE3 domain sensor protein
VSRQVTVGRLLNRAFATMVVLILLSGIAGIAEAILHHQSVRQLTEQVLPLRLANAHLRVVMSDAQRALRGYLLTGDERFQAAFDNARVEYGPTVWDLRARATTPEERQAVEEQARAADRWWRHVGPQRAAPPQTPEAAALVKSGQPLFEPILAANAALDDDLHERGEAVRRRSELLRNASLLCLVAITVLAALTAGVMAVRTTGRITRPLRRHVDVLRRLGEGDHGARESGNGRLAEMAAVARAVNAMADEADRARAAAARQACLQKASRDLGIRIRQHLSVGDAMQEAATGLGTMLDADHAVVRLATTEGSLRSSARWSRAAPDAESLAGLSPDWLLAGGGSAERAHVWTDLTAAELPPEEQAALRAVGATATLTVAFSGGAGPSGAVTLIRTAPGAGWSEQETGAAESVTADLGRGLLQAQLYEREQELVASLRDLDNAKTDFVSTVSHELRTPLTSIAGYLEMLDDGDAGPMTEPQRRMLAVIERNTARLRSLIEDLLVLSRIESGTLQSARREIEFGWLVTSAVAAVGPVAEEAGVVVETEIGAGLTGKADPEQMDRVLMNLLSNAVKFTPKGGRVRVTVHREEDEVMISVADSGIGIPEADQRNLFQRFFRASNAVEGAVPGTGLGLAIVRTIVAQHGGRISLDSSEGEGTTVTVWMPA